MGWYELDQANLYHGKKRWHFWLPQAVGVVVKNLAACSESIWCSKCWCKCLCVVVEVLLRKSDDSMSKQEGMVFGRRVVRFLSCCLNGTKSAPGAVQGLGVLVECALMCLTTCYRSDRSVWCFCCCGLLERGDKAKIAKVFCFAVQQLVLESWCIL